MQDFMPTLYPYFMFYYVSIFFLLIAMLIPSKFNQCNPKLFLNPVTVVWLTNSFLLEIPRSLGMGKQ